MGTVTLDSCLISNVAPRGASTARKQRRWERKSQNGPVPATQHAVQSLRIKDRHSPRTSWVFAFPLLDSLYYYDLIVLSGKPILQHVEPQQQGRLRPCQPKLRHGHRCSTRAGSPGLLASAKGNRKILLHGLPRLYGRVHFWVFLPSKSCMTVDLHPPLTLNVQI